MIHKRKIKLSEPEIYNHENVITTDNIVFLNRSNTDYKLVKDQFQEIGNVKTYKDHIMSGIDPNYQPNQVYGVGKKLQPKNNTINEMKSSINLATETLKQTMKDQQIQNQQNQQEQLKEIPKEEVKNDK